MASGDTIGDEWLPSEAVSVAPGAGARITLEGGAPQAISIPVGSSIAQAERQLILATFEHCGHNKERTAALLGISLKTLYNRLKEFGGEGEAAR